MSKQERVAIPDSVAKKATEPTLNQRVAAPENQSPRSDDRGFSGAATQIRTGDLILTKDVLYQLSHSSKSQEYFLVTLIIITKIYGFVNSFTEFILGKCYFLFIRLSVCDFRQYRGAFSFFQSTREDENCYGCRDKLGCRNSEPDEIVSEYEGNRKNE